MTAHLNLRFNKFRGLIKSINDGRNSAIHNDKLKLLVKAYVCIFIQDIKVERAYFNFQGICIDI